MSTGSSRRNMLLWGSLAAVVTIAVGTATIIAVMQATRPFDLARTSPGDPSPADPLAQAPDNDGSNDSTPSDTTDSPETMLPPERLVDSRSTVPAETPETVIDDDETDANKTPIENAIADISQSQRLPIVGPPAPWVSLPEPTSDEAISRLNEGLRSRWVAAALTPAPEIDDRRWADRAFQVLLGRRPDAYEAALFDTATPVDRATWAVRLTEDPKYRSHFALHWGGLLADSLLDRRSSNRRLIAPESFRSLLAERIGAGGGLDRLTYDLLTASGGLSPAQEDFDPAVSFLVALDDGRGVATTRHVLERFLGEQGRCAVCHDHDGAGALTQLDFWGTNAHLRQVEVQGNQEIGLRLVDVDFVGDAGDSDRSAVFFETSERQLAAAFPRFVAGVEFPESGRLERFDRRRTLGAFVIADQRFPVAWVDWIWSQVFEYPLGPDSVAASPTNDAQRSRETRAALAGDFAADGFRLDHLLQWIVLSEAFSRDESQSELLAADRPWNGTPAAFARWYPSRTRFESIAQALAALDRAYEAGPDGVLALRAGGGTSVSPRTANGNGVSANVNPGEGIDFRSATGWNTDPATERQLNRIVTSRLTARQKVEHLFLAATGSPPTESEWHRCERWLEGSRERLSVYQDIWFALTRSDELR